MEKSAENSIDKMLNWLVNQKIKENPIDFARAKIVVIFVLVLDLLAIIMSSWTYATGETSIAFAICIVAVLVSCVPFTLRWATSFLLPGGLLTSLIFVLINYVVVSSGGILTSAVSWYGIVFLLGFIIIGPRGGSLFGGLSLVSMVVIYFLGSTGAVEQKATIDPMEALVIFGISAFGLVMMLIVYSRMNSEFQNALESTVEKAEQDEKLKEAILTETNKVMILLAEGDISRRITSDFVGFQQLKKAINSALEMLGKTISNITDVSDQVTTGANELLRSSQSLASGTTEQAASLEEISSSMNEIGGKAKINNENASRAQALSEETTKGVLNGNEQMKRMVDSMEKISGTSSKVSKVIKVIDEIAFQTNLLALNAAVEAARAGKYGKGFAVVAEEVRNLASRSAEAAKSTTELIENSLKEINLGVDNATKTADVLNSIKTEIDKVNDLIGEIAVSSQEQVSGVNEINISLSQVNNVVQQNSSISEEAASASEELSKQATELHKMVRQFKLAGQPLNLARPVNERRGKKAVAPPVPQFDRRQDTSSSRTIVLDDDEFGKY
ncbi:hypothetical protein KKA14_04580 [bacterium]|nr:hypothetical protein [bacterium]